MILSKKLAVVGRILFALPFGVLGVNHFAMSSFYIGKITTFIPGMGFSNFIVGFALVAASVCLIINRYVKASCYTLSGLLFLFILLIHIPNLFSPETFVEGLINLMKDTSLLGGALVIANINFSKETTQ